MYFTIEKAILATKILRYFLRILGSQPRIEKVSDNRIDLLGQVSRRFRKRKYFTADINLIP